MFSVFGVSRNSGHDLRPERKTPGRSSHDERPPICPGKAGPRRKAAATHVSVKSGLAHPSRMRRKEFSLNRFGAVENRKRRTALSVGVSRDARNIPSRNSVARLAPGQKALLVPFGALAKRHCGAAPVCYRAESYCAAYARTGMSADESAVSSRRSSTSPNDNPAPRIIDG